METRADQGQALVPGRVWTACALAIVAILAALFVASNQSAAGTPIVGVTQVSAGGAHTCALQDDGRVMCWGANGSGQIGDGTKIDRDVPTPVEGLPEGIVLVRAGNNASCAVDSGGRIWCWGMYETTPTLTHQFPGGVVDLTLSMEGQLDCALTETSGIQCWNALDGSAPDVVIVPGKEASAISAGGEHAGGEHACGVISGTASCWGSNMYGQLGDGTVVSRQHPGEVLGIDGNVLTVSLGMMHSCALTEGGDVWCWGSNSQGQLGDVDMDASLVPVRTKAVSGAIMLDTGGNRSCALTDDGEVFCWGGPYGSEPDVIGIPGTVTDISVGLNHACALIEDGRVRCWGSNGGGRLGAEAIQSDSQTQSALPCDAQSCIGLAVLADDDAMLCHSGQKETCRLQAGASFTLTVDIIAAPEGGYIGVQSFIDFGAGAGMSNLTYTSAGVATDEFIWPDQGLGLRNDVANGLVYHGGLTGLIPPLAVSSYVGPIVQMAMTCSQGYSETTVRILPGGDPIASTSGAMFLSSQDEQTVPSLGSLEVICGEDD